MERTDFKEARARLNKTQKELAQLLGISIKAVHSYEQGWRKIPHHVERQILFLLARALSGAREMPAQCWEILNCPQAKQENCPAKEFNAGDLCWFINGTQCSGRVHGTWAEKMEACRACRVFQQLFNLEQKVTTHG